MVGNAAKQLIVGTAVKLAPLQRRCVAQLRREIFFDLVLLP